MICVGVIPRPQQFKDLYSFLIPLLEELLEIELGVETDEFLPGNPSKSHLIFRAFLIIVFGDIPAVAKMLSIKGHNAITPCRTCFIVGFQSSSTT